MDDPGFTAVDKYFGDGFADRLALRDGVKMTLALGAGADGKIGLAKGHRLSENRSRHGDGFIEGKCSHQRRRRSRVGCEMASELDSGFQLNCGNEGFEYFVEQLDLLR